MRRGDRRPCYRGTRASGTSVEHYHPSQIAYATGGPRDATMMLALDELCAAFAGWERLHAFEGEREVHEGRGHQGKSYVTQAILRKPDRAAAAPGGTLPA